MLQKLGDLCGTLSGTRDFLTTSAYHQNWLQGGLVGSAGSGLKMKDWDKALAESDEEEQDRAGGSEDGSSDEDFDDELDE